MDLSRLITRSFWDDPAPHASGIIPKTDAIAGHVLFQTSGSTGAPKWVALSKAGLLASASSVNRHLEVSSKSCWGLVLPLHHVGGFGVIARVYAAGCEFQHFDRRWNAAEFSHWLEQHKITHSSLVPTQVHDLVKAKQTPPPSLRAIVVGGGHLDVEVGQTARDLGWPVLASYGMTEAGSQIATQTLDQLESPYQSAPIPLLPMWEAKVNEDDLLCVAGIPLFSGYVIDGQFSPRESKWHCTSDRAILKDRRLTPLGRADNLVKILGELVDPESIERELVQLSNGQLAADSLAVIALPDARAGHVLVPVFEASVHPATIASTLQRYAQQAPGFCRLLPATAIEALPRSELGKLYRNQLRELLLTSEMLT